MFFHQGFDFVVFFLSQFRDADVFTTTILLVFFA